MTYLETLTDQATAERRRIASAALLQAAQGRLADPADILGLVDLDSIHVAGDGATSAGQLDGAVQAAREQHSALVWRPAAETGYRPRGLVRAPAVVLGAGGGAATREERVAGMLDNLRGRGIGAGAPAAPQADPGGAQRTPTEREARVNAGLAAIKARAGIS